MTTLLEEALSTMEANFVALECQVPKPERVQRPGGLAFRYREKSIYQAMILKLARVISGLHAAKILWLKGFVQEQAALQRILDELNEDLQFLIVGAVNSDVTELHIKYLSAFFEEEFGESDNPRTAPQKRPMIPRKKIRAYLSRVDGSGNPSNAVEVSRTLSKTYSGYVHAAATQIMDMYGGDPPKFHVTGMVGTVRIEEHGKDLWNYFYRGLLTCAGVAMAFGDWDRVDGLYRYIHRFETSSGTDYHEALSNET